MNAPLSQRPPRKFRGRSPSVSESLEDLIVAGDVDGVASWLDRDPDAVNKTLRGGTPPLLLAVALEQEKIVELLVTRGADLLLEDDDRRMAVHIAAEKCHPGVMSVLLRAMKRKNPRHTLMVLSRPQANGRKPVFSASKDGKTLKVIVNILNSLTKSLGRSMEELTESIGINECHTETGLWPMHVAAANGNVQAVEALIASGADLSPLARAPSADKPRGTGSAGMTPLMLACQEGCIEAARTILSASMAASTNVVGVVTETGGVSALHLASMMGHGDLCDLLIECGADPNRQDANGKRPVDYLMPQGQPNKDAGEKVSLESKLVTVDNRNNGDSGAEIENLVADAMKRVSDGGHLGLGMGLLGAPILDMEVELAAPRSPGNRGSSPTLERGLASSVGGVSRILTEDRVDLPKSYLGEPVENPTLAYLIPHVEKALVSLSKKYEAAAVRDFKSRNSSTIAVEDHHPKDAFATYMLRHKHDRTLPQPSALKK